MPYKFKIGVAGCPNNCSEVSIKDLGWWPSPRLAGPGRRRLASGINPRLADDIATNLSDEKTLALAARVLDWFKPAGKKRRLGKIINEIGLARFKENWARRRIEPPRGQPRWGRVLNRLCHITQLPASWSWNSTAKPLSYLQADCLFGLCQFLGL